MHNEIIIINTKLINKNKKMKKSSFLNNNLTLDSFETNGRKP